MIFPIASTFVTELLIGWILVLTGIFHALISLSYRHAKSFSGALIVNLITFASGLFLLVYPATGALVLTLLIAFIFMIQGGVVLSTAMLTRPFYGWRWLFASGIASIILGMLIGVALPSTSKVLLGFLLGLNLAISGLACVMIARAIGAMNEIDMQL